MNDGEACISVQPYWNTHVCVTNNSYFDGAREVDRYDPAWNFSDMLIHIQSELMALKAHTAAFYQDSEVRRVIATAFLEHGRNIAEAARVFYTETDAANHEGNMRSLRYKIKTGNFEMPTVVKNTFHDQEKSLLHFQKITKRAKKLFKKSKLRKQQRQMDKVKLAHLKFMT
jgi:hypothetical protein